MRIVFKTGGSGIPLPETGKFPGVNREFTPEFPGVNREREKTGNFPLPLPPGEKFQLPLPLPVFQKKSGNLLPNFRE